MTGFVKECWRHFPNATFVFLTLTGESFSTRTNTHTDDWRLFLGCIQFRHLWQCHAPRPAIIKVAYHFVTPVHSGFVLVFRKYLWDSATSQLLNPKVFLKDHLNLWWTNAHGSFNSLAAGSTSGSFSLDSIRMTFSPVTAFVGRHLCSPFFF